MTAAGLEWCRWRIAGCRCENSVALLSRADYRTGRCMVMKLFAIRSWGSNFAFTIINTYFGVNLIEFTDCGQTFQVVRSLMSSNTRTTYFAHLVNCASNSEHPSHTYSSKRRSCSGLRRD